VARRSTLSAFAAVAALGVSASPVLAQDRPVSVDLSAARPGSLPAVFVVARTGKGAPAAWAVVDDPTAHGGRALAQTSTDRTDHRFPLAIDQNVSASNVEVTVRFKAVSGQVDRAGGIAVRLVDPDNYDVVRANALEDNVNLYRVVKGVRTQIRGARTRVSSGEWHTLGLRAEGERFAVSFDGRPLFTAADQTFTGPGKVALWTKADSVTRFDDLAIRTLP
jgi:glycosyl hydrolase family 59 (putative galactocerebrosidase)